MDFLADFRELKAASPLKLGFCTAGMHLLFLCAIMLRCCAQCTPGIKASLCVTAYLKPCFFCGYSGMADYLQHFMSAASFFISMPTVQFPTAR